MSHEKKEDETDDPEKEAGFEFGFNLPLIKWRMWGGPKQLTVLMPIIRWGLISATGLGTLWALKEIFFK